MRRYPTIVATAALMALGLAGCGSISERTLAGAFSSPGKYDIYTCADIEMYSVALRVRQIELEQVMGRATQGRTRRRGEF